MHNVSKLDREEIEQQHEIFFGLDKTNKNNHLSSFWRTECMPIVLVSFDNYIKFHYVSFQIFVYNFKLKNFETEALNYGVLPTWEI